MRKIKMEDNVIKDVRNLFRLKKVIDDKATEDIRNLLKLKKEKESIKDKRNQSKTG